MTARSDPVTELEIVGATFHQRFEPSDLGQAGLRRRHGGAECEADAFETAGGENPRSKVGGNANGFEVRGQPPVRCATIQAGDGADRRVAKWRGHGSKIAGRDVDVAVAHDKEVVSSLARQTTQL